MIQIKVGEPYWNLCKHLFHFVFIWTSQSKDDETDTARPVRFAAGYSPLSIIITWKSWNHKLISYFNNLEVLALNSNPPGTRADSWRRRRWRARSEAANSNSNLAPISFSGRVRPTDLNGGGAGADDGDPLAAVVVAVVPAGRVERRTLEPGRSGELGDLAGMPG